MLYAESTGILLSLRHQTILSVSDTTVRISLVPQFARTRENSENYFRICNYRVAKKHKSLSLYAYTESWTS